MTAEERKKAYELWQEHCKRVQNLTTLDFASETPEEKKRRIKRLQKNYAAFCEYYFPHYLNKYNEETGEVEGIIHNAPFHNAAAELVKKSSTLKAVFKWPRGHAKSTHLDVFTPTWLMIQSVSKIHVGVIVGKSEDSAQTLLGDLQAELEYNQRLIADFGEFKSVGNWQDGEFVTQHGVAFFARGRGQSPRGLRYKEARPDYIVIDDLDDDELCRNPRRVREMTNWVKEALFGALDVGRGRFIMVGNLISKTSVLANIAASKGVHVSEVKAVDKDGNPIWKEKWTKEEAKAAEEFMGYRSWQKEMMHNPIAEGTIFKPEWIRYKKILPLDQYEQIVCYIDPSFKSRNNDYKASRMWGKIGKELHLLDCYVRQDSVRGMVRWVYDLYERLPENVSVAFFMESNFMQDTLIDEFEEEGIERGYQLPIAGDNRKKPDKIQRIENISPLWERGYVFYNEDLKDTYDMQTGIDQTLAVEHGSSAHDDAPDADEGAIWKLQKRTRQHRFTPRVGRRPSAKNNIW